MDLVFSAHARQRMAKRRIREWEVAEALERVERVTEGRTPDRINVWGRTRRGRRIRITQYRGAPNFVLTVVAPDEERA